MASPLIRISGPAFLTITMADIYTPPASTIYTIIRHIHVANEAKEDASFDLRIATQTASNGFVNGIGLFGGAGQDGLGRFGVHVPGEDYFDWVTPGLRMDSGDFLIGRSNVNYHLVITVMGERYVV